MDITGKVVKSFTTSEDTLRIEFEDGTSLTTEISRYNTSCHCHPEYEYSLETTFSA